MTGNLNNEVVGRQFIVYPRTGIQLCRAFPLPSQLRPVYNELWHAAVAAAERSQRANDQVVQLVGAHIACPPGLGEKATGWIRCAPGEFAFYRLVRAGEELVVDLVIDTERGAGARPNTFPCILHAGLLGGLAAGFLSRLLRRFPRLCRTYEPARFNVSSPTTDVVGTLIMDFGNSGSAFAFIPSGSGAIKAEVLEVHNPFDPHYAYRPPQEGNILRSNLTVLRVDGNPREEPWIVMGARAEELIRMEPAATYVSAPKKYVRHWPTELATREPYLPVRGILGEFEELASSHFFIRQALRHMLQCVLASLTNPGYRSTHPEKHPQFVEILLTYPLTWRDADKELFQHMVEETAQRQLQLRDEWKSNFRVALVCSEPVAVAAYIVWEAFFHFGMENPRLLASALGNDTGTDEVRLLVIDLGGGSTDIAVVEVRWDVMTGQQQGVINVSFQLLEAMRFNRAGDRLSHLIATAIREFLRKKYGIEESLALRGNSTHINFTDRSKRQAVSKIFALTEAAKVAIAEQGRWQLSREEEVVLTELFKPLIAPEALSKFEARCAVSPRLVITDETLRQWVRADRQCPESNNEPGFMDIFLYLDELSWSLGAKNRLPHLVVLSGRTARLPFIRDFAANHLHLPLHRVQTLEELWPRGMAQLNYENMNKLAVVCGAQRFYFDGRIRFFARPDERIFNRFIGPIMDTPGGLKLRDILIRQGDPRPRTIAIEVVQGRSERIGHAFREDGLVQILATVTNRSDRPKQVQLQVEDDFTVRLKTPDEDLVFIPWVPGGVDVIVDNFNDTGDIDGHPTQGFITNHVLQAVAMQDWICDQEPV
jgi:hypothetical protein